MLLRGLAIQSHSNFHYFCLNIFHLAEILDRLTVSLAAHLLNAISV